MELHKPYLSLTKTTQGYLLEIVLQTTKNNCITRIVQQEIEQGGKKYWGVIITVSDQIQLVNGPDEPIISTSVVIDLDKSATYKTIKCVVEQKSATGTYAPAEPKDTHVDFSDGAE